MAVPSHALQKNVSEAVFGYPDIDGTEKSSSVGGY